MAEESFEDQLKNSLFLQGLFTAMPQLISFYPQIEGGINYFDKELEEKVTDKMYILVKKNGVTRLLVLDTKIDFTISSNMQIEAQGNNSPLLHSYEKSEYKAKLLNSSLLQSLKEKYEKTRDPNKPVEEVSPEKLFSFFTKINSQEPSHDIANTSAPTQELPPETAL